MPDVDPRTPILVGVGTCSDDAEAVELMARAALAAADDARSPGLLAACQRIAVPKGTWSYTDPARVINARIGADARTVLVDLGIPQQTLINQALSAIVDGELDVALVVGGEAKARAARLARAGTGDAEIDQQGAQPDERQSPAPGFVARPEVAAGLVVPVQQYALMESALRAREGRSIDVDKRDIASLQARFNAVAQANPDAAFRAPMTAEELATFGPSNRPLAFPYAKWHATQWTVDQAAALLLCSAEAATRYGVALDRWLYPLVGLESSLAVSLSNRAAIHRWPAMGVLGRAAAQRIGRPLAACDLAELYSCFPVAVRIQQRELGLDPAATPTITGGMAFAGGPFNNFVLQATAAMGARLRATGGLGLVTTVSGLLTKPGLAVWSAEPDGRPPLIADLGADAARETETVEVLDGWDGAATVAAVTVTYDGLDPVAVSGVLDTPSGARVIASSRDAALIDRATTEELVGVEVRVKGTEIQDGGRLRRSPRRDGQLD